MEDYTQCNHRIEGVKLQVYLSSPSLQSLANIHNTTEKAGAQPEKPLDLRSTLCEVIS
jgi:hypothetical protein